MKKTYLLVALAIVANALFAQNFTEGNLVLLRHNMEGATSGGTTTGSNSTNGTKAIQIFLDEYKLAADGNSLEFVQSVPLPATIEGVNNPVTTFGADDLEGYMTRSYDGRYLIVPGYGVATGTELSASFVVGTAAGRTPRENVQKSVAVVDYAKNVNSQTLLPATVFANRSFIGATSYDGTDLWLSGGWGAAQVDGPYYAATNSTAAVSLGNTLFGQKDIRIFNNQLYTAQGFGNAGSSNAWFFYKIGNGLPKTNTPANTYTQENIATAYNLDIKGFYMAKLPNGKTVVYVANGHANSQTIRKYSQKEDGSYVVNFVNTGTSRGVTGIPAPKAIDGKVDPVTGKVTLYILSNTRNAAGGNSGIYVLEDESGHNETAEQGLITGTPKLLLDKTGDNIQFRSIAWAPVQNSVLPIKLSSFEAKYRNNQVDLSWKTSLESNNSHFEVLRSDGTEFKVISTVKGKGDSNEEQTYHFTDHNPLSGVSYYQLRQVDFDGKSELSKIIPVSITPQQTEIKVYAEESGAIAAGIYAVKEGRATVEITDVLGRKLLKQEVELKAGYNTFTSHISLKAGVYVVTVQTGEEVASTKFVK